MSGHRTGSHDVIVATTRRSWTKAQKLAIVAEVGIGDATLSEVARRHGIHSSLLFRWRRALGGERPVTEPVVAVQPSRSTQPALTFVPVVVPPEPASPVASASPSPSTASKSTALAGASVIEIVLANGRVLRLDADVDTAALVRIVSALEISR